MIPKKIHYCWFGRTKKTKLAKKCINSWKKYCPDFEIIEWNEDNFDIAKYPYAQYCYDNKKWAFLSDFVRLLVIEEYGGVYFDTDVQVIRNFDYLLEKKAFYGFESSQVVNTGEGFGSEAGHSIVSAMKNIYLELTPDENGVYSFEPCPALNTKPLLEMGLKLNGTKQIIEDAVILPVDYLNPYNDQTGKLSKSKNTISIHWYSKSWISLKSRVRSTITKPFHRIFGVNCFRRFKK